MRKNCWIITGIVFLGIAFLLKANLVGAEDIKSPIYESRPQELVIYEGNLAYAKDTFQVYPQDFIRVFLPATVINRTVEIIEDKKKIGSFYFVSPQSAMSSMEARLILPSQPSIFSILQWESKAKGPTRVYLSYLLSGISWSPSYAMDILADNKVRLRYNVAIFNQTLSLSNLNVKLVSGMVGKIQEAGQRYAREGMSKLKLYSRMDSLEEVAALPSIGATRINAYYTYDLGQMKTLERGMNYVVLLDKELEAEKEFVWLTSSGKKVDVSYALKNSSKQPFAAGMVETYQDNIYMGSDMIEWTPSGSKGHVTIGGIVDVRVEKSVNITKIPERHHTDEYRHEIELKVENFSKKDIQIKVIDNKYPDCVDITFSLKPTEEKAMTYIWEIELKAGKSKFIHYDFYSDSTYYEPYRAYR